MAAWISVASVAYAAGPSTALQVETDVRSLEAAPALAAWRVSHPKERVETARYDLEYSSQGRWCARAISEVQGLMRSALFYVPEPPASLSLPAGPDKTLVGECKLLAFWYEVRNPPNLDALAKSVGAELTARWGQPKSVSVRGINSWDAGNWNPFFAWQRGSTAIWVAGDPRGRPDGVPRLLVISRAAQAPAAYGSLASVSLNNGAALLEAAAGVAGIAPPTPPVSVESLADWVEATAPMPAERKAAALVMADRSVTYPAFGKLKLGTPAAKRLERLGGQFQAGREGAEYTHSWLRRAEQLDAMGPGGEIARAVRLTDACSFEGKRDWRFGLVPYGEKFLTDFPTSRWAPDVHYTLGHTYAAQLLWAYPEGDASGNRKPLLAFSQIRAASVGHFRAFLEAKPDAPEAGAAWREAWRLLAGLPPTQLGFGCDGD